MMDRWWLLVGLLVAGLGCTEDSTGGAEDAAPVTTDGAADRGGPLADRGADRGSADSAPVDQGPPTDRGPDGAPGADAQVVDATPDAAPGLPFGSACTVNAECEAGLICVSVGMLGLVCSLTCTDASECPAGSMGQRCNQMGLCRP